MWAFLVFLGCDMGSGEVCYFLFIGSLSSLLSRRGEESPSLRVQIVGTGRFGRIFAFHVWLRWFGLSCTGIRVGFFS